MTDDTELTDAERAALDAWTPLAAPAQFADRVLAARAPVARRRWPFVAGGLAAAAAAAVAVLAMRPRDHSASGEVVATTRTTTALGDRGIAVAEPEATLAWRIDEDGDAVIEQRAGDVFYRVERGGSFVVHTPAGDARVTGTCFRVEVEPMNRTKQILLSGAVGAAVATGVVITVYEGSVIADAKRGTPAQVSAGHRATLGPDGRTVVVAANAPDPAVDIQTITRDQLIARATSQQNEIEKLRTRVAELESRGGRDTTPDAEAGRAWYDPSPERLKAWAAECKVRVDEPGLDHWQPQTTLGRNERGIDERELPQINAALSDVQQQWKQLVRALYIEATGDTAGADTLSTEAMRREIAEKSGHDDEDVRKRIAQERAGLAQPPSDLSKTSPFERMMRAYLALGEQSEQAIAKRLGADRAHAIRGDGWSSRSDMSGCPDPNGH